MFNVMSFIYVILTFISYVSIVSAHGEHERPARTGSAFNTASTNLIPQPSGAPTLYYNGSGLVPPYNQTTPPPTALPPLTAQQIENNILNELLGVLSKDGPSGNCSQCITIMEIMHLAAITQPAESVTNFLVRACEAIPQLSASIYASSCYEEFSGIGSLGPYYAQLLAKMSMATGDMQGWCFYVWHVCPMPDVISINETEYFKAKPENMTAAPASSGKTLKVLHISDWHLDSRYEIGSEANCSQYLCCRPDSTNTYFNTTQEDPTVPASRFGYLYCDPPPDLALSAFFSMDEFVDRSSIDFTIFTGDIVSHDYDDQLSQAYVEYEEVVTYQTFKAWMGGSPIYPTLGNHDSFPQAFNSPNSINNSTGQSNIFSWNYELLSSMWLQNGWIDNSSAQYAATHYGAYSTVTPFGLKIVSINTDMWYIANIFNFYNMSNPDNSGILQFLAEELQASEDIGQRVWIIGHVLSGYNFGNPLPNPTALFYSIVRRFSPTTIAGIFFGHTHEDQLMIYYDYLPNSTISSNSSIIRNTTMVDYNKPLQVGYIGPSITPLSGNNAGWRLLEIDAETFSVVGMQTYFANVSAAATWTTPAWEFEYDTRAVYDPKNTWPPNAPLNGTFWDNVTREMLKNNTIVEIYNFLETKSSVVTGNCSTAACAEQKVCYLRAGSAALSALCPSGAGPA